MGMKRFIIRLLVFLSLMFILDRGFGVAMKYLQDNAKGGYVGHHNYILHQSNEDILIFGSSRAIHHYNPQIIEDSLGMSCYNCGQDGNGIVLFYGWWQLMKERHLPKVIIYDVNPDFDLIVSDNVKYLGWLRSEYDNKEVKEVFEEVDPTEKYKMFSMLYRYNSKFLQNITDFVHPVFNISSNGYLPLNGALEKMKIRKNFGNHSYEMDSLKLNYIQQLIEDANEEGVKVIMVASPIWYGQNPAIFEPVKKVCEQFHIPFYNYSSDVRFVHNDKMFKDGSHLNSYGADEFTNIIGQELKSIITQ